jgi:hypothetical protein
MLFRPLAQNRHKTGYESIVFSSIYMRATKTNWRHNRLKRGSGGCSARDAILRTAVPT